MAEYSERLIYEIEIDEADLSSITSRVAKASAAGVAKGAGMGGGSSSPYASGGAPGGPIIPGGGFGGSGGNRGGGFGGFGRSVTAFSAAANKFVTAVNNMAKGTVAGATSTSAAKAWNNFDDLFAKIAASQKKASKNDAKNQQPQPSPGGFFNLLRAVIGPIGSGLGGIGAGHTNIGKRLMGFKGGHGGIEGGGTLGQKIISLGGGLGGLPIGMAGGITTAITMAAKNLAQGAGQIRSGAGTVASGAIGANASTALHGLTTAAQGAAQMLGGPVLGTAVASVIGVLHGFVDAMDGMVEQLGKYNGATSAALGKYEAQQIMMQVQLSQMLEPLMVWWVELKSKILSGIMSALKKIIPFLEMLWEGLQFVGKIILYFTPLGWLIQLITKGLEMLMDAVKYCAKGLLDFTLWLLDMIPDVIKESMGLSELETAMKKFRASLDDTTEAVQTGLRDKLLAGARPLAGGDFGGRAAGGGPIRLGRGDFIRRRTRHGIPQDPDADPNGRHARPGAPVAAPDPAPRPNPWNAKPPVYTPQEPKNIEFNQDINQQNTINISTERMIHDVIERLRGELFAATRQGQADARLALTMLGMNIALGDGL